MIKRETKTQPIPKRCFLPSIEQEYINRPRLMDGRAMSPFWLAAALSGSLVLASASALALASALAAYADNISSAPKREAKLTTPASVSKASDLGSKAADSASKLPTQKSQVSTSQPKVQHAHEANDPVQKNKTDAGTKSGQPAKQSQTIKPDQVSKSGQVPMSGQVPKSGQLSKEQKSYRVIKSPPANSRLVPPPPPTTPSFLVDPSMVSLYGLSMPIDSLSREALKDREKEISVQFKDASAELEAKRKKHNERQERAENFKELYKEGVVSRREMETAEAEASEFAGEVERLESKTKELKSLLDRIKQRLAPPTKAAPRKLIH
jgi:myosin heavy subunit